MSEPGRSVILVGFMGAGKSSVGRVLARRLGFCFLETDDVIGAQAGKPIPAIFAEHGEPHFRALEAEALALLESKRAHVIATGGGFACRAGAMERLRALGTVVWLAGDFDVLYARASRLGGRPMLAGRSRDEVAALYESRKPYYGLAHLAVDTTRLGVDGVVAVILRHLRRREGAARVVPPGVAARPGA